MSKIGPLGALRRFFTQQDPRSKTLVIGFSGGADSYALLDSCDRLRQEYGLSLVVAHLDHGWRESSAEEAEQLAEQIARRGLVWTTARVEMEGGPNLEERAREARLAFFTKVQREHQAAAVLLAHQQDDLVETTLKRVLEGAALDKLHGLRPVHRLGALWLWRPFLGVARAEIERYVARRRLPVVNDPTNQDPRFLRSRMRYQMIPQIESLLGKGIRRPLAQLARRSQELELKRHEPVTKAD